MREEEEQKKKKKKKKRRDNEEEWRAQLNSEETERSLNSYLYRKNYNIAVKISITINFSGRASWNTRRRRFSQRITSLFLFQFSFPFFSFSMVLYFIADDMVFLSLYSNRYKGSSISCIIGKWSFGRAS